VKKSISSIFLQIPMAEFVVQAAQSLLCKGNYPGSQNEKAGS
jgi:hypothetical protein